MSIMDGQNMLIRFFRSCSKGIMPIMDGQKTSRQNGDLCKYRGSMFIMDGQKGLRETRTPTQ